MTQERDTATDLSASDEWSTPKDLFAVLSSMYGPFALDVCSSPKNALCPNRLDDALDLQNWHRFLSERGRGLRAYMNPPYSRGNLDRFMPLVRAEVQTRALSLCTCTVPACTDTGWWHRNVEEGAGRLVAVTTGASLIGPRTQWRWAELTVEVIRVRGRIRFVEASGATGPARFPNAIVTYSAPGVLPLLEIGGRKRGPEAIVTPELDQAMRDFVEAGLSISEACERVGIARKTWYRHLERQGRAA